MFKRTTKKKYPKITEIENLPQLAQLLEPNSKYYKMGAIFIIVSVHPETGEHLSISHPSRYPSWDEIAEARYQLLPDDRAYYMVLPPSNAYGNLAENCFHLWAYEKVVKMEEQAKLRRVFERYRSAMVEAAENVQKGDVITLVLYGDDTEGDEK